MRRLRYKLRYGKFFKDGILGYLQKIMVMVAFTLLVTLIISFFIGTFKTVLKFSTLGVAIIGVLSVIGGNNLIGSSGYMITKANSRMTSTITEDVKLRHSSYSFCVFMGLSAAILYIIYSLI